MNTLTHWFQAISFAGFLYPLFLLYGFLYTGSVSIAVLSESVAGTAGVLIGCSFILSVISYFFDFLDRKIILRKYLGLVGYWLAVAYSASLSLRFPEKYLAFPEMLLETEVQLGLGAMLILTSMMLISNTKVMTFLGVKVWRRWLRLGYLAYALLIWRAVIVEGEIWNTWLQTLSTVPPPRLLLSIFASSVILARIAMVFDQVRTKRW